MGKFGGSISPGADTIIPQVSAIFLPQLCRSISLEGNPGVNSQQNIHYNQVVTDLKELF